MLIGQYPHRMTLFCPAQVSMVEDATESVYSLGVGMILQILGTLGYTARYISGYLCMSKNA